MVSFILETERLLLRPPSASDIGRIVAFLNDFEVAGNLARVPFPYTEDDGCAFIVSAATARALGEEYTRAIAHKTERALIRVCSVRPKSGFGLGYWIAKPYWGQGFATEAMRAVVEFALAELGAERLAASWFHENAASGRVLAKLGAEHAGEGFEDSLSRSTKVFCHKVVLTRANFEAHRTRR